MSILKRFTKQPSEVQDYDIDFSPWLVGLSDTISSFTATSELSGEGGEPPSLETSVQVGSRVKVWLSGGTNGSACKVTVRVTTAGGRVKEEELMVKVKET